MKEKDERGDYSLKNSFQCKSIFSLMYITDTNGRL